MDVLKISEKFGNAYIADEMTYVMGIDVRLTHHVSSRFKGRAVLETCTGGGFTAIPLASNARHVFTVEIDGQRMAVARENAEIAGVSEKITFINNDIFCVQTDLLRLRIDAAFLDPDWAVTGPHHVYRFHESTTRPPSDILLRHILAITPNVTLIQPPYVDPSEYRDLPPHECERLYLDGDFSLFALHFGELAKVIGETEFRVESGA